MNTSLQQNTLEKLVWNLQKEMQEMRADMKQSQEKIKRLEAENAVHADGLDDTTAFISSGVRYSTILLLLFEISNKHCLPLSSVVRKLLHTIVSRYGI